jgi:hypothetical protein
MAGETVTLEINTKAELKLWRIFNRSNRLYRLALTNWTIAYRDDETTAVKQRLNAVCQDIRQKVFLPAAGDLADCLGLVWSKYHTNTTWICRKTD